MVLNLSSKALNSTIQVQTQNEAAVFQFAQMALENGMNPYYLTTPAFGKYWADKDL